MSPSNSAPRKPPETRFCDLKINNAIMVKIVVSEVDFRVLQTNDWTNRAMQLICITRVLGLSSVKISAQSVRQLALHLRRTTTTTTTTRRPPHMNPKTPPGVSTRILLAWCVALWIWLNLWEPRMRNYIPVELHDEVSEWSGNDWTKILVETNPEFPLIKLDSSSGV